MAKVLVEIGGWAVSLNFPGRSPLLEPSYEPFLALPEGEPSAEWRVNREPFPAGIQSSSPFIPPLPRWEIVRQGTYKLFRLQRWMGSPNLWKAARMDPALSRGEIWTDRSEESSVYPLRELDQLLFAHFFIQRRCLIVHAAAARIAGRGYLFSGPGGAGKSTWSALLGKVRGCTLLGDDKVVLRETGDGFRIYSTPWNPSLGPLMNDSAPLAGIYFLRHREENAVRPLKQAEAFKNLLQQTFLPFAPPETEAAVSLLEAAAAGTGASSFGFRPDRSATDCFLSAIAGKPGEPAT